MLGVTKLKRNGLKTAKFLIPLIMLIPAITLFSLYNMGEHGVTYCIDLLGVFWFPSRVSAAVNSSDQLSATDMLRGSGHLRWLGGG